MLIPLKRSSYSHRNILGKPRNLKHCFLNFRQISFQGTKREHKPPYFFSTLKVALYEQFIDEAKCVRPVRVVDARFYNLNKLAELISQTILNSNGFDLVFI